MAHKLKPNEVTYIGGAVNVVAILKFHRLRMKGFCPTTTYILITRKA